MNPLIELLQKTDGAVFVNEDGLEHRLELLPPLTGEEFNQFEASLPCRIPADIRELTIMHLMKYKWYHAYAWNSIFFWPTPSSGQAHDLYSSFQV